MRFFVPLLLLATSCAYTHPPCKCTCEVLVPAAAHVHDVEAKQGEAVAEIEDNPPYVSRECERFFRIHGKTSMAGKEPLPKTYCRARPDKESCKKWLDEGGIICSPNIVGNTGGIVIDCETGS